MGDARTIPDLTDDELKSYLKKVKASLIVLKFSKPHIGMLIRGKEILGQLESEAKRRGLS